MSAGLNLAQLQAVHYTEGPCLVLAGAGSGKTRVITHKIGRLIETGLAPRRIAAITFTNKAAAEMRERAAGLIGRQAKEVLICTFHSLGVRMVREDGHALGLKPQFSILDTDDVTGILKDCAGGTTDVATARQWQWTISGWKNQGWDSRKALAMAQDDNERSTALIMQRYEERLTAYQSVDFDDLIGMPMRLLRGHPEVREKWQRLLGHVLVDEYQDTNATQYELLKMLVGERAHFTAVGDDDQSIYGWRGAKIENIQRFLTDYQGAETIRLEQNYRSTANILKAANSVIANNAERLGKELWTEGAEGEPISLYAAFNEVDEARFVVGRLKDWKEKGGLLADCAILYRSNAQSRVLEEALMQDAMPYRIYGGLRFFERQEIKDAMAYLRLINNRGDDASFERVVNTPTRGIGDRTLEILRNNARDQGQNLWQSAKALLNDKVLTGRAGNAVRGFVDLIDALEEQVSLLPLHQQADIVIQHSGLKAMYLAEKGEKSQARVENLDELVTACRQYQRPDELEDMSDLSAFLAHAALESGENQADEYADAVQLMTLHSAKGLEYPLVLLVGVEEGMFPSQQSTEESGRLEEERRLCYVGMTRAMEKLYICYAESRRIYGREMFHKPSRFIREMPAECLEEIRLRTQVSRPTQYGRFSQNEVQQSFDASGIKLGQRVLHPKFGEGIVLNFEGVGQQSRVQIQFDDVGAKWLVTAYARLEAL